MISRTTSVSELRSRICRLVLQLKHLEQTRSRLALQLKQTSNRHDVGSLLRPCGLNWPSSIKIISRRSRRSRNDRSLPIIFLNETRFTTAR